MDIETSDDIETALILLGVGLLVGAVASRGRRSEAGRERAAEAISRVHRVADQVAQGAPDHLVAVTVVADGTDAERVEKKWSERGITVPLAVVQSPSGEFTSATLAYIDEVGHRWENTIVNVLVPEFYVQHWWGHLLHNQTALILKGRLLFRKSTAVTSIPYHVE